MGANRRPFLFRLFLGGTANLIGRGARMGEPLSSNKARSRQVHVSLTLRVTEEFLERLDQWRAQQISPLSRNATVVALIEGGIQREGAAIDLTAGADLPRSY